MIIKYTRLFLGLLILITVSCRQAQQVIKNDEVDTILKGCLNDANFKRMMMYESTHKNIKRWYLHGNIKNTDTFIIEGRRYTLKDSAAYSKSDSTLLYHVTYPEKRSARITFSFHPYPSYEIYGDYRFTYSNGWYLKERINGIRDKYTE